MESKFTKRIIIKLFSVLFLLSFITTFFTIPSLASDIKSDVDNNNEIISSETQKNECNSSEKCTQSNNHNDQEKAPNLNNEPDRYNAGGSVDRKDYGLHGEIIENGNALANNKITEKYKNLVKKICQQCDRKYGANLYNCVNGHWEDVQENNVPVPNDEYYCRMFHGKMNYVGTLKFLWKLAKTISQHQEGADITTDVNNAVSIAKLEVRNDMYDSEGNVEENYRMLFKCMRDVLKKNYDPTVFNIHHTEAGRCKYIVFGCIMHLIGDLSSHRFVVPTTAIETWNNNSITFDASKHLYRCDFTNNTSEMIGKINNHTLCFSNLASYSNLKAGETSGKYIDKKDFYPQRVDEAQTTVSEFLDHYSSGYDPEVLRPHYMELQSLDIYIGRL